MEREGLDYPHRYHPMKRQAEFHAFILICQGKSDLIVWLKQSLCLSDMLWFTPVNLVVLMSICTTQEIMDLTFLVISCFVIAINGVTLPMRVGQLKFQCFRQWYPKECISTTLSLGEERYVGIESSGRAQ